MRRLPVRTRTVVTRGDPGTSSRVVGEMRPTAWCGLGPIVAVLALSACYPTNERGVAAASARDWPRAESELWRAIQGPECVGVGPTIQCKQAFAMLGEVLLEDDRPFQAATTFRMGRDLFYGKQIGDPTTNRDLDRRVVDGLAGAKRRWDQYRGGSAGQCRIIVRYAGPGGRYQLHLLWTELDLGQARRVASAVDGAPLFDSTTEAGPHAVTVHANYVDSTRPGFHFHVETTYFRSCPSSEQIDVLFQVRERAPGVLAIDPTAKGGSQLPLEGPLRPGGIPSGP